MSEDDKGPDTPAEFVPPTDGSWVPRDRLNREIDRVDKLEAQIQTLNQKPAEDLPSTATLWAKVEDGELSQEQFFTTLESQVEDRVTNKLVGALEQRDTDRGHKTQLERYQDALPDLAVEGTELNTRVSNEYRAMLDLGLNPDAGTMVAALRSAVGPLEKVKATQSGKLKLGSHEESGGEGSEDGKPDTRMSTLTQRQKDYYGKMISGGAYKDWDAVFEDLTKHG